MPSSLTLWDLASQHLTKLYIINRYSSHPNFGTRKNEIQFTTSREDIVYIIVLCWFFLVSIGVLSIFAGAPITAARFLSCEPPTLRAFSAESRSKRSGRTTAPRGPVPGRPAKLITFHGKPSGNKHFQGVSKKYLQLGDGCSLLKMFRDFSLDDL